VLLLGGASVGADLLDRSGPQPRREPTRVAPSLFPGLDATAQVVAQDSLRVRLLVEVRIAAQPVRPVQPVQPVRTGRPGGSASAAQVRLQAITAPGLVVRLGDRPAPLLLGYVGRFGSGLEQVVELTVDVVALGCAEPDRPRRLSLSVRRSTGATDVDATVPVQDRSGVTQALEELVRRSCA